MSVSRVRYLLYLLLLLGIGLSEGTGVAGRFGDASVANVAPALAPALSAVGQSEVTIHLTGAGFDPDLLFITAGTEVTWQNDTNQTVTIIGEEASTTPPDSWEVYVPLVFGGGQTGLLQDSPSAPSDLLFEVSIPPGGSYTYTFNVPGVFDYHRQDNPAIQGRIIVEPIAGNNDSEPSPLYEDSKSIYEGPGAIQVGMDPSIIDFDRVALIHGFVGEGNVGPLPGVRVSLKDRPEYGFSTTRDDGSFDIVFNGGGAVVLEYELQGYLPVQRAVPRTPWQDVVHADTIVMIPLDAQVTTVNLANITEMVIARGTAQSDRDGDRQATLLFPAGTTAELVMADGNTQPINLLHVRATEYTVGGVGPSAMPGTLPPASGYTYAAEFSADEALAAGAVSVQFSQPIINYTENFIEAPVGTAVPTGYYNRQQAIWVPGEDGLVIAIIAELGGLAELDADGDGDSDGDDDAILANLGVSNVERGRLADLYAAGQELWRVAVNHFTPFDHNWPFGPPAGSPPPPNNPGPPNPPHSCGRSGSIIRCEAQTLTEGVSLTGTPYYLAYTSDRQPGWTAGRELKLRLLEGPVPDTGLRHIALEIEIAGQRHELLWEHPDLGDPAIPDIVPNLSYTFVWDGLDSFGNPVVGEANALVKIGYGYPPNYYPPTESSTSGFGQYGNTAEPWPGRQECAWVLSDDPFGSGGRVYRCTPYVSRTTVHTLRHWNARDLLGFGGWSLSVQHHFDPAGRTLYLGDGTMIKSDELGDSAVTTVQDLALLDYILNFALGSDGSYYVLATGTNGLGIYRQDPEGVLTQVGGNGTVGNPTGDGGPATEAVLGFVAWGLDVAADGNIYFTTYDTIGHGFVRRIDPDGVISTVAGDYDWSGPLIFEDGHPATQTHFSWLQGVAVGPDGLVYFADYGNLIVTSPDIAPRIRRINANGIIETVVGGVIGELGDEDISGVPAVGAVIGRPYGLAFGPDNALYFADYDKSTVNRVTTDGILTRVAGDRSQDTDGDGGSAITAGIGRPTNVIVAEDGTVYLRQNAANQSLLRRVTPDGVITTYAGKKLGCSTAGSGEFEPLLQTCIEGNSHGVAIAPNGEVHFSDGRFQLRRAVTALPTFSANNIMLPSTSGMELYEFSPRGRHLNTYEALTGALINHFTYDENGLLIAVTDRDGNFTQITRNNAGIPSAVIAPWGQITELELNADGYLSEVTDPAGDAFNFGYKDEGGLLTSYTTPRGGVSAFDYDGKGRLIRDEGPDGMVQELARLQTSDTLTITVSTGLGIEDAYVTQMLPTGAIERRLISAQRGATTVVLGPGQTTTTIRADGTQQSITSGPDPRWGMRAPLVSESALLTPAGRQLNTTTTVEVTLDDPLNPMSLATWQQEVVLSDPNSGQHQDWLTRFDRDNSTLTISSPVGRDQVISLDERGRIILVETEGQEPIAYSYNARGQVLQTVQGSGDDARATSYEYNTDGRLQRTTDPLGRVTTFAYDSVGRLSSQTLPGGRTVAYGYNANGELTSLTPPGQPAHTFAYDQAGMITRYTPPAVGAGSWQTQYIYDEDRRIDEIISAGDQSIDYSYDPETGRRTTVALPGSDIEYEYDPISGNVIGITRQGEANLSLAYDGNLLIESETQGPLDGVVTFDYDNFMRLKSWTTGGTSIAYQYDQDNLITKAGALNLTRNPLTGLITATNLNTVAETRAYSTFAELVDITVRQGAPTVFDATYSYDALSRLKSQTELVSGNTTTTVYGYDAAGRLATVERDGAIIAEYTYDANGNRLTAEEDGSTRTAFYNDQDQLMSVGNTDYSYTRDGRLTGKTTGSQTTSYEYDLAGNLTEVMLPDGTQITYRLDGLNRRTLRVVDSVPVQGFVFLNEVTPIAETDGSGNVVSLFVYGSRPNVPDYMVRGGATYRIISDRLGSPRLVINSTTGQIMQRLEYDAWGQVLEDTNPGFQPFGFAGGLYDPDTGLVRFGARDYDPEVGRWTAKDPILFAGGDTNLYTYVFNDPVNRLDPMGLWGVDGSVYSGIGGGAGYVYQPGKGVSQMIELGVGVGGGLGFDPAAEPLQGDPLYTSKVTLFAEAEGRFLILRGSVRVQSEESESCPGNFDEPDWQFKVCLAFMCTDGKSLSNRWDPSQSLLENLFRESGAGTEAKAGVQVQWPSLFNYLSK